jgi:molybdenum cofactor cytidylyltransferase
LGARIVPLLNKVTGASLAAAREVAHFSLTDLHIDRVLLGQMQDRDPVWEARRRIGAVILAAGESRRMGQPKMLLPWKGGTIIRQVCQQVIASGVYEVVVVAGRLVSQIQEQIGDLPVQVVLNPDYEQGEMLSSLQVGLRAIWRTSDACMVVLGDQPAIQPAIARDLADYYCQGRGRIVAPSYQQRRGHPLIIDRAFWQPILDLPPGAAPRDILRANEDHIYHHVVNSDSVLRDVDTPDEYRRALDESR